MPKTIVFCADGTWNGPGDGDGESVLESKDIAAELTSASLTNVVKLYANLAGTTLPDTVALKDEDEKVLANEDGQLVQVSKYLHGVGDSANPLVKFLGGVFGVGLVTRVVRGYTFISRYYEPGDSIHICGFSRGAYTARALASVISRVGLLDPKTYDPSSKLEAYRLGVGAWAKSKSLQLEGLGKLTQTASELLGGIEWMLASCLEEKNLRADVPLSSVAVWDTVGSMGIPEYVKGARADILRFADSALSPRVKYGFHAMSVDELRADFPVTKWDSRDGVTQTWFAGAHGDVGGGYVPSESRLSDLSLSWMLGNLSGLGVRLNSPLIYVPSFATATSQPIHTPWTSPPFDHLGRTPRVATAGDDFHPSVRQRWKDDPGYRPQALQAIW